MEITNVIVTTSAATQTDKADFRTEYTTVNGDLKNIHCNIHKLPNGTQEPGEYVGAVYMEHGQVSCNMPFSEQIDHYFETTMEIIRSILDTTPIQASVQTENSQQR